MLAAQTTEESLPKKSVKIVVLMEPTMAVDEAIDEVVDVNSIDIAQLLEGEDVLQLYTSPNLLTVSVNPRNRPPTAGVEITVRPNSMMSRLVKPLPKPMRKRL